MLTDIDFANNINNFITEQITYPGAKPCPLPTLNPDSTAITVKFDSPPGDGNYFPSLEGLEGCTSVVIIGENGCWISHFWEVPSFYGMLSSELSTYPRLSSFYTCSMFQDSTKKKSLFLCWNNLVDFEMGYRLHPKS